MKKELLISVIVPVFGTEHLLLRALNSLRDQSYSNLEIIVVNDKSPGDCADIVASLMEHDSRILYVENTDNLGLFRARIEGAKHSSGDYIAFLDSDDYLAKDVYRRLINESVATGADLSQCNMVLFNEQDEYYIHPNNRVVKEELSAEDYREQFFGQRGLAFHWHTVWNKLIRRDLWDKSFATYMEVDRHLIMAEDLLYSTILATNLKKYCSIDYDGIFYFQNSGASTSNTKNDFKKFKKNITDLGFVFKFLNEKLSGCNLDSKLLADFEEWKLLYSRFWVDNVLNSFDSSLDKSKLLELVSEEFQLDCQPERTSAIDHYSYRARVEWDRGYEQLVEAILWPEFELVSFDIFDTLITRRMLEPHDVFDILEARCKEIGLIPTNVSLSRYRVLAEKLVRDSLSNGESGAEEITYDQIYEELGRLLGSLSIPVEVLAKIKQEEVELELSMLEPCEGMHDLVQLAAYSGKKVYFVSDIYFNKEVIKQFLSACGISIDDENLLLSSEELSSKHFGGLFEVLNSRSGIPYEVMLHVGDNRHADDYIPKSYGIHTFHIPCKSNILRGETKYYSGALYAPYKDWDGFSFNGHEARGLLSNRATLGAIKNLIFPTPFPNRHKESFAAASLYSLGASALGPHVWAILEWFKETVKKGKTLFLIGRDGWLLFKGLEYLELNGAKFDFKYVYLNTSRKALISSFLAQPSPMRAITDLVDYGSFNRSKLISYLFPSYKESDITALLGELDWLSNRKTFEGLNEFLGALECILSIKKAKGQLDSQAEGLSSYIASLDMKEGDYVFDIGYSGTASYYLQAVANVRLNSLFIHTAGDKVVSRQLESSTFYESTPAVSGAIRELLFSQPVGSCIGYSVAGEPIHGTLKHSYQIAHSYREVERGVFDFLKKRDFLSQIVPEMARLRKAEQSYAWERFLSERWSFERSIFGVLSFEDGVSSKSNYVSMAEEWPVSKFYNNKKAMYSKVEKPIRPTEEAAPVERGDQVTIDFQKLGKIGKFVYLTFFARSHLVLALKARLRKLVKVKVKEGVY